MPGTGLNAMLGDVVEVRALEGYQLLFRFEDGAQGGVDVAKLVSFKGVCTPAAM